MCPSFRKSVECLCLVIIFDVKIPGWTLECEILLKFLREWQLSIWIIYWIIVLYLLTYHVHSKINFLTKNSYTCYWILIVVAMRAHETQLFFFANNSGKWRHPPISWENDVMAFTPLWYQVPRDAPSDPTLVAPTSGDIPVAPSSGAP